VIRIEFAAPRRLVAWMYTEEAVWLRIKRRRNEDGVLYVIIFKYLPGCAELHGYQYPDEVDVVERWYYRHEVFEDWPGFRWLIRNAHRVFNTPSVHPLG